MAETPLKPAWILHRRPYQEGRLLVELLTKDEGKVTAVWSKPKRGYQGEPFVPLLAKWSGRGSVLTLSRVEPVSSPIRLDGRFLYMGLYLNELCYRLLGPSSSQALFSGYQDSLVALSRETDYQQGLRSFEHLLLSELGVFPDVYVDCLHQPISPSGFYQLNDDSQFQPVAQGGKGVLSGMSILSIAEQRYDSSSNALFRYLIDMALAGRVLESRRLYEALFTKGLKSR